MNPDSVLSQREQEVLRLLASGLATKEIAWALAIGVRTVETHRATIMAKLAIRHVPGLVKYAIRHQLTSLED